MKHTTLSLSLQRREEIAGFAYLLFELLLLPQLLLRVNQLLPHPLSAVLLNFTYYCINFLAVVIIFRRFLLGTFKALPRHPGRLLTAIFLGTCLYFLINFAVTGFFSHIYPSFYNINDQNLMAQAQSNFIIFGIGAVFLVPVAEELLFRTLVFGSLYRHSPRLGYLLSAVLFSSIHVLGYLGSFDSITLVLCFLQYLPAGLLLALCYVKTDSILAPIGVHVLINTISLLSMR